MRRFLVLLTGLLGLAPVAPAYYHWTFFSQQSGPFQAMRLKFDVAALPDATVSFFIAKQGPAKLVEGDNFTALVSQIRRAGETWNVRGSALKLKFGGFQEKAFSDVLADQVTPGIDVVFDDDLPPGVLAYSDPLTYTDLAYLGAAESRGFAPILRSRLQLASDLAVRSQASYSDAFFLTMVHEFGHTLGLQHSMTGGAMATSITRGTTKAAPLAADDVAGLSVLYPTAEFQSTTGNISGRVTVARNAANLASVVALSSDGTAVGAMTLPDGSYKIEGLTPGDYWVYAHPLPPAQTGEANAAGIVPPQDLQHVAFLAAAEFQTRFYPGTKDWKEAVQVHVHAAKTESLIDFDLQTMSGNGIYNLRMFGYLGAKRDTPVHAPPLAPGFSDWVAFQAAGTQIPGGTAIVPGLHMSVIGDAAVLNEQSLRNFPGSDQFLLIAATVGAVGRAAPVAVALTADDNLYVLPGAFHVVPSKHPLLTSVAASQDGQGQRMATIAGENLNSLTRVTFDGADALSVKAQDDGSLVVAAPPAAGQHQAAMEVFSAGGQTSWQLQGAAAPLRFPYDAPPDPVVSLTPGSVLAGTSTMLEIEGAFTDFLAGKTSVGFGTSDIVVRQMWVLSPTRLLLNISVDPKAKLGATAVTVSTGIQLVTLGAPLQVRPADAKQISMLLPIVNDATGLAGAPGGGKISIRATGVPADIRGWLVVISGVRTPLERTADGRLLAPVARGMEPGPQPIQLIPGSGLPVPSVLFQIDRQPPVIVNLSGPASLAASAQPVYRAGDRVTLLISNLDAGDAPLKEDVEVRVAGLTQRVEVLEAQPEPGLFKLEFLVSAGVPAGEAQSVTVRVGTRVSSAATITIATEAVQ